MDQTFPVESNCKICNGQADRDFKRIEVWQNLLWRLTASTYKQVKGFCYLEPKRHIRNITELNGEEARTFGAVVAAVSNAIKIAFDAKLVYLYVFGDHIPHLHVHLAPHHDGDIFQDDVVKNSVNLSEETVNSEEVKGMASSINSAIKF